MLTIPTDYAWSTWTLTNVTDSTTHIIGTASGGTAVSPSSGYDATSGYVWDKLLYAGINIYGLTVEVRTADSSAGLSSADYFEIRNDCTFPLDKQKRYIQIKITFTQNADGSYPEVHSINVYSEDTPPTSDTAGLTQSTIGSRPTWDRKFKGRLYQCAICGLTYRIHELVKQRGVLVCRKYCKDLTKDMPSKIQIRRK